MIDAASRRFWARPLGFAGALGLALSACSANDTQSPGSDDDSGGTGATSGASSGGAGNGPSGGAGPAGTGGTPAGGAGTGSGGVAGTPPGGAAGSAGTPAGGAAGSAGAAGGVGGGAGTPAGGAGGGSGAPATLVQPIQRGDRFVLEFEGLVFEVDPAVGARVSSLRLEGTEFLSGPSVEANAYGSTFWTSPQNGWCAAGADCWPPPPEIDNQPYATSVDMDRIVALGNANAMLGASVAKRFGADLVARSVVIEYQITATDAKSFAPWEITRVPPNGVTFFGSGSSPPVACGGFTLPAITSAAGAGWYQWASPGGTNQKACGDGAGWIAHLAGDILLVKKFADVPAGQAAPDEGEIEIFVDGMGRYVEVENQGAYQAIAAGMQSLWPVTWYVRRLPSGLAPGTPELVAYVQSLWQ